MKFAGSFSGQDIQMGNRSVFQRLVPNVNQGGNFVRSSWDRMEPMPGGRRLFSLMVGRAAPYTGSIGAQVRELRVGFARVTMRDRPHLRNHLSCVHAVALANLGELTGNVALAYSLPDDARFIVAGMQIEYKKKARGMITGICEAPAVDSSERMEYEVVVSLRDESNEEVTRCVLRTLVGPKKS